jgi:hypothetical protein
MRPARCPWLIPVILATQEAEIRGSQFRPAQANSSRDHISKTPNTTRAGGVAQMVECQPIKREALRSNPSTIKKQKNKKKYMDVIYEFICYV